MWGRCEESAGAPVAEVEGSGSELPDDSGAVVVVAVAIGFV